MELGGTGTGAYSSECASSRVPSANEFETTISDALATRLLLMADRL